MKLNKNQQKFFEVALEYFGEDSNNVRLMLINKLATEQDLIVPTSVLRNNCQREGLQRGCYDLTLVGVAPKVSKKDEPPIPEFKPQTKIILEKSSYI